MNLIKKILKRLEKEANCDHDWLDISDIDHKLCYCTKCGRMFYGQTEDHKRVNWKKR